MCPKRTQRYGQEAKRSCNPNHRHVERSPDFTSDLFGASPTAFSHHPITIAASGGSFSNRKSFQAPRELPHRENSAPVLVSKEKRPRSHRRCQSDREPNSMSRPFVRDAAVRNI